MTQKIYGGYFGRLKVYGWLETSGKDFRVDFPTMPDHWTQARVVVAARSKAEAARLAGFRHPREMWNLSETGNVIDAGVALNEPGVVFWRPLDGSYPYKRKASCA